ncbi:MAG: threonine--tRNA ligase [Candidatus Calescibacterium sp.]|nr:threonine--tRNA ligase [Candidatus Calescibacterium sp.]
MKIKTQKDKTIKESIQENGLKIEDFVVACFNGKLVDLSFRVPSESEVEIISVYDYRALEVLRHSAAHLMAQAVKRIYKGKAKITIGPPVDFGFYYDIDFENPISDEDLPKIEDEMKKIVHEDLSIVREEIPKDQAIALFKNLDENYKVMMLEEDINEDVVSIYRQGEFVDLCKGPHVVSTGRIKHFKLLSVSGAYWKGNEKNKMLQRIYGTAFFSDEELQNFIQKREEAKKRDHRVLGSQLELFEIEPTVGGGLVIWLPKGERIRYTIEEFLRKKLEEKGYLFVRTPHIANADLWRISGHLAVYNKYMFPIMKTEEEQEFVVKPMNCPFHIKVFQNGVKSYKDLPLRIAEYGTVYRYEKSGVLHGLLRVRGFTQDDAHIFCTPEQVENEIIELIDLTKYILGKLGFDKYRVYLSTRPEEFVGDIELWYLAEQSLKNALDKVGVEYTINEGEGAFYGPKIDVEITDALSRTWQCSTIQLDFNLPQRFGIYYIGPDNSKHVPVMIHRAILGSFERFFGILIEHYGGEFPLWLAPIQVIVLPVSQKFNDYSEEVFNYLKEKQIRVEINRDAEKLGYKIRQAEIQKIPFMLIVGQKEKETNSVTVRQKGIGDIGKMSIEEFFNKFFS